MKRRAHRKTSARRRLWPYVLALFGAATVIGLIALVTLIKIVEASLPEVPSFAEYAAQVPKVSRVLAADGTVVAEFFTERRTVMQPDAIPPLLKKAVLAAEDAAFFEHEGLSYVAILRAALTNFWRGRVSQGGSTITQQVVKQVLLSPERTYERKFRELLLAKALERKLSKAEILAIYMTEVYLGHGRYGFEEAARFYFGKAAKDLSLEEAALLAGLISAPEANSPVRNPVGAVTRQRYVLGRLAELGWVSEAEAKEAASRQVPLLAADEPRTGAAPYFVDAVRREVQRMFGLGRLNHDGLVIETTLDLRVSDAAEVAAATALGRLFASGRTRELDEEQAGSADLLSDGSDDLDEIPPPPRMVRARVKQCGPEHIEVQVGTISAAVNLGSLSRLVLGGVPDIWSWCRSRRQIPVSLADGNVDVGGKSLPLVNAELGPQIAMVVLDARTRAVLAMTGGDDFSSRPFNRAVQSRRPIGSTVKPFLYAAALANGMDPARTFQNTPLHLVGARGRAWRPRNYEGGYDGREYGIAEALARSINVIAVRAMMEIGAGRVADLLNNLGIPNAPRDLSLALGSAEASPLALANAMAAFAQGGKYDTPYMIERVRDHAGKLILEHEQRPQAILPAHVAGTIRDMLRQAVLSGTARLAASLPYPVFGKTGTTNRSREAWFVGSDGRLVCAVLVGYDDRLPMKGATGGEVAVPIFSDFMRAYHGEH